MILHVRAGAFLFDCFGGGGRKKSNLEFDSFLLLQMCFQGQTDENMGDSRQQEIETFTAEKGSKTHDDEVSFTPFCHSEKNK